MHQVPDKCVAFFAAVIAALVSDSSVNCRPADKTDIVRNGNGLFTNAQATTMLPDEKQKSGLARNNSRLINTATAKTVWMLSNKVWDLNRCPSGIQIRIGRRRLDKERFFCSKSDAMMLAPMLHGDSLENRMYVWCRVATVYGSGNSHLKLKRFQVEQLQYFEEDVILTRETVDDILAPYLSGWELGIAKSDVAKNDQKQIQDRQKRKVGTFPWVKPWPNAEVYFTFNDRNVDEVLRSAVMAAISIWEQRTCLRFRPAPLYSKRPRILFYHGDRCASGIGMPTTKRFCVDGNARCFENVTPVQLGQGCYVIGVVLHEIGHALGFYHEQSRRDRDEYVTVDYQNVNPTIYKTNFIPKQFSDALGIPYDYSSVMHYGSKDFGETDGIVLRTKDPEMQMVIGQRVGASFLDVKAMNVNYCSRVCRTRDLNWEECKNGGYRNPNSCSSCVCPKGFAPPFCEELSRGLNADCGRQQLIATDKEQVLTSPGFHTERGLNHNAFCPWLITVSTPGKRVRLRFRGRFNINQLTKYLVCEENVEIRYKDIVRAGPRLCQPSVPRPVYRSHGPQILLSVSTLHRAENWQGFQAVYSEENCGGCSGDASDVEPVCVRTRNYTCPRFLPCVPIYCPYERPTTCYQDEDYCCEGFSLTSKNRCIRSNTGLIQKTADTEAIRFATSRSTIVDASKAIAYNSVTTSPVVEGEGSPTVLTSTTMRRTPSTATMTEAAIFAKLSTSLPFRKTETTRASSEQMTDTTKSPSVTTPPVTKYTTAKSVPNTDTTRSPSVTTLPVTKDTTTTPVPKTDTTRSQSVTTLPVTNDTTTNNVPNMDTTRSPSVTALPVTKDTTTNNEPKTDTTRSQSVTTLPVTKDTTTNKMPKTDTTRSQSVTTLPVTKDTTTNDVSKTNTRSPSLTTLPVTKDTTTNNVQKTDTRSPSVTTLPVTKDTTTNNVPKTDTRSPSVTTLPVTKDTTTNNVPKTDTRSPSVTTLPVTKDITTITVLKTDTTRSPSVTTPPVTKDTTSITVPKTDTRSPSVTTPSVTKDTTTDAMLMTDTRSSYVITDTTLSTVMTQPETAVSLKIYTTTPTAKIFQTVSKFKERHSLFTVTNQKAKTTRSNEKSAIVFITMRPSTEPTAEVTVPIVDSTPPTTESTLIDKLMRMTRTSATPLTPPLTANGPNMWSGWSRWSACTAECGLCGERVRTRVCLLSSCSGPKKEKSFCGKYACGKLTEFHYPCKKTVSSCGRGWFTRVNRHCVIESTFYFDMLDVVGQCQVLSTAATKRVDM